MAFADPFNSGTPAIQMAKTKRNLTLEHEDQIKVSGALLTPYSALRISIEGFQLTLRTEDNRFRVSKEYVFI